ncbi:T-kininogen 1-like isoform X2 [Pomacea canaliculata]|uniref:T-kininogen 1-like isoform X2 n=1 Tax=Pomacea canaliculata TaxID=400727 RepID=UPI000D72CD2F|nr:T-kininogen 1-like isoform X2 [Pomacea canaliculata]
MNFHVCLLGVIIAAAIHGQGQSPPGGRFPIPPDSPFLQPAVSFAAAIVNRECNCVMCQTIVVVTNATEQFESGVMYNFLMEMADSNTCLVVDCLYNVSSAACPPDPLAPTYWCNATVYARPWENPPYILEGLSC